METLSNCFEKVMCLESTKWENQKHGKINRVNPDVISYSGYTNLTVISLANT